MLLSRVGRQVVELVVGLARARDELVVSDPDAVHRNGVLPDPLGEQRTGLSGPAAENDVCLPRGSVSLSHKDVKVFTSTPDFDKNIFILKPCFECLLRFMLFEEIQQRLESVVPHSRLGIIIGRPPLGQPFACHELPISQAND